MGNSRAFWSRMRNPSTSSGGHLARGRFWTLPSGWQDSRRRRVGDLRWERLRCTGLLRMFNNRNKTIRKTKSSQYMGPFYGTNFETSLSKSMI